MERRNTLSLFIIEYDCLHRKPKRLYKFLESIREFVKVIEHNLRNKNNSVFYIPAAKI